MMKTMGIVILAATVTVMGTQQMIVHKINGIESRNNVAEIDSLKFEKIEAAAKQMRVFKTDGTEEIHAIADIDSITFQKIGPDGMVFIPSKDSSFFMGSDAGSEKEQPVHMVTLTYNFWVDTIEVTQKYYSELMSVTYPKFSEPSWDETFGVGDNYPAYYVNWYDALLFCNARTKNAGSTDTVYSYDSISGDLGNDCIVHGVTIDLSKKGYRLPTEAEWEYAYRGGTTTEYYWGTDESGAGDYAWYWDNSKYKTHPVAQKIPNEYGLYDICGNVWEWCNDFLGPYSSEPVTDPTGPDGTGPNSHRLGKVLRGGSWDSPVPHFRYSVRFSHAPQDEGFVAGFRCVFPAKN